MKRLQVLFTMCWLVILFSVSLVFAKPVTISINGLVVDSHTLLPIAEAVISDANEEFIGTTNKDGYFDITFNVDSEGEIDFKLSVEKDGYNLFTQKEHWAETSTDMSATFYLGLQESSGQAPPFSELNLGKGENYEEVMVGFDEIKQKIDFENKLKAAKKDNEKLLLEIEGDYYLVSDTGWLKLNSSQVKIRVNGTESIPATDLNSKVKRSSVKYMSPTEKADVPFEIRTH